MKKYKRKLGFSLIEVLISVLLVVTVGVASLTLHFNSFKLADKAAVQTQAYYLASEAVEGLKVLNYQNTLANHLFPDNGEDTIAIDDTGLATCSDDDMKLKLNDVNYFRLITVEDGFSTKYARVKVGVCYGIAAVNKAKCQEARDAKKDYIETISVIKRKP